MHPDGHAFHRQGLVTGCACVGTLGTQAPERSQYTYVGLQVHVPWISLLLQEPLEYPAFPTSTQQQKDEEAVSEPCVSELHQRGLCALIYRHVSAVRLLKAVRLDLTDPLAA